ncbi:hypothetical protein [Tengunoibacter tsumagoiensis]|uniref:Uncharacterized protein n=1 Tax=Tengunoibacter tsumagoiensis TaxID=2014871 RepID=A0A402A903_9CHLR|nr:hypothetical protein [Tengunoibacter tsumagoiensis]GCE15609.1 hypothetical protein KTT_54680 [Tengunoibacter tsumagoiensis]
MHKMFMSTIAFFTVLISVTRKVTVFQLRQFGIAIAMIAILLVLLPRILPHRPYEGPVWPALVHIAILQ